MSSPYPIVIILSAYLWFVFKAGPQMMANRKAINLKWIIICYNICQIIACSLIVERAHTFGFSFKNTWKCINNTNAPYNSNMIGVFQWTFFAVMVRIAELLETIFFVLRKKQNQVSILHVYHHTSTILLLWIFTKYSSGFMEVYLALLNSGIHVIMYSYYLLTSFKVWEKYLKMFKPILTSMQLIQFIIILGHCTAAVLPSCRASPIFYGMFVNVVLLFILFGNFFIKNYLKTQKVQ
ncbi:unnamed protein product [Diamesa hyperborea]